MSGGQSAGGILAASGRAAPWLDRRFLRDMVIRSAFLWLLLHLAWIAIVGWIAIAASTRTPGASSFNPVLVVAVVVIVLIDAHALRERTFLANVGIGAPPSPPPVTKCPRCWIWPMRSCG